MKVLTVTGGGCNRLELTPDTMAEMADLIFAAHSEFLAAGFVKLIITPDFAPYIKLLVFSPSDAETLILQGTQESEE